MQKNVDIYNKTHQKYRIGTVRNLKNPKTNDQKQSYACFLFQLDVFVINVNDFFIMILYL